jgi:hypothetical protein
MTAATEAAPKKAGSFFGLRLPTVFGHNLPDLGVTLKTPGPVTQVRDMVAGAAPGLVRLGTSLVGEGTKIQQHNTKERGLLGAIPGLSGIGLAQNLFRASDRQFLKEKAPLTYQLGTSPVRTLRQIPDTAIGSLEPGVGFGKTDLGKQIKQEGVLPTVLAKAADISMLAGGAGVIGKAAGAGHLAKAAELEKLAGATATAAKVEATESALAKAAIAADAAGDATKAIDLAKAADQAALASKLREGFTGFGERATEKAGTVAHLGGKVAAAPFVPTERALGLVAKGGGLLAKSAKVAPYVEKFNEALRHGEERRAVGDSYHETVRAPYQAEMHTIFDRFKITDVARGLSKDEQAAIYIGHKSLEGLLPGSREAIDAINDLPEEVRPDALKKAFGDAISPKQYELARKFNEGTLPAEKQAQMQAASDALSLMQDRREVKYVTGEGTSVPLSEAAKEARAQRAAGESADMDVQKAVDKATHVTRSRLARIENEANTIDQTPAEPVPNSPAQERRLAAHAERTRRAELTAKAEQARGERTMSRSAATIEKNQTRAKNRTGQVIGRARGRLEEAGQLQTGVEATAKRAEGKAVRLNAEGTVAEERASEAQPKKPSTSKNYQDLTPKQKAESTAAAKYAAADEAATEAGRLKGVKAPDMGKVRSDINLDAQRANVASRAENETANKLLGQQADEQRAAVEKAQKKLAASQSAEAAAKDRFERENQVRGEKAQDRRLATLDRQREAALTKLAKQEEEARNSVAAAPPQDRPALVAAHKIKQVVLKLAEDHPDQADRFLALADDIATTKAELEAKGVKTEFFLGGKAEERMATPAPNARYTSGRKLQSERNRLGVSLQRNIAEQTKKYARETLDQLHNKFRETFQTEHGSTVARELGIEREGGEHAPAGSPTRPDFNPPGHELAADLEKHDLVAWDSKSGKALDVKDITPDSEVLPKHLFEAQNKWTAVPKDEGFKYQALRFYDHATKTWKHSVLALSPRWHAGNIIGNAALATLGAGLSPAQILVHGNEARKLVKAFEAGEDIPAEHVAAMQRLIAAGFHNPDLATVENAKLFGRLLNKSYAFNETVDSINRVMVYLAKEKSGVSSEAAVQLALKAAGDFTKMTPVERQVIRRVIPFYAWQRHITRLAFSLPVEAPARVAWTLHLATLENQLNPDPGKANEFNDGTIPVGGGKRLSVRSLDPYGSSFWTDPTFRGAGYALNPVIKLGTAALTGINLNKGPTGTVSGKFRKNPSGFGAPAEVMAVKHPKALAQYATGNVPQIRTLQDFLAGDVPVRYDTGEPRKVGPGASKANAKPTLTGRGRMATVARFLGVPFPEPEAKATTKKKKTG